VLTVQVQAVLTVHVQAVLTVQVQAVLTVHVQAVLTVQVQAVVAVAEPFRACEPLINADELVDKIVIVERGDCMFVDKVTY